MEVRITVSKLETRTLFTGRQDMYSVMASPTERNSVIDIIPKLRGVLPRFNVVGYSLAFTRNILVALLAHFVVSNQNKVSPLDISKAIKLSGLIAEVISRLRSLGGALLLRIGFITAFRRTEESGFHVVWISPERLSTADAILELPLFHHFEFNKGVL